MSPDAAPCGFAVVEGTGSGYKGWWVEIEGSGAASVAVAGSVAAGGATHVFARLR